LKFRFLVCVAIFSVFSVSAVAETSSVPADTIVENYCTAAQAQAQAVHGASMDVEIDVSLPKLKKHGRLHALRRISPLGLIRYERAQFEGDRVVIKEVISRYLTAEVEAQREQSDAIAVTPRNYKFKYKGMNSIAGQAVHVFEVTPRQKRDKLFKGEVWIDARTFLKVRESGYLIRNPDFMVKKVAFTRTYDIRDGISVPRQEQSVTNVRLFGKVELTIDFSNFSIDALKHGPIAEFDGQ
jgi:hypothetical protein